MSRVRWHQRGAVQASLVGGVFLLLAPFAGHLADAIWPKGQPDRPPAPPAAPSSPPLEIVSIEPIEQRVSGRVESEHTTFRATVRNSSDRPVSLETAKLIPGIIESQALPLAGAITIGQIPHSSHHAFRVQQFAAPTVQDMAGVSIPPGTSAKIDFWLDIRAQLPETHWLKMSAKIALHGTRQEEAVSPPFRVRAFTGGNVTRLSAPSDLRLH